MIEAGEVEEAMEQENAEFGFEWMAEAGGLAGGGVEGDGEVAGVLMRGGKAGDGGWERARREAEDVGRLVFAAEGTVEAFELGVGGEEDIDGAGEADGGAGAIEEAREGGLGGHGVERLGATGEIDGDHGLVELVGGPGVLCVGTVKAGGERV